MGGTSGRATTFRLPKIARAGSRFTVKVALPAAEGRGTDVTIPSLSCSATLGGRPLATVARTAGIRAASCVWKLPATSHGRTLRGVVAVDTGKKSVRRVFTRKIR